MPATTPTTRRTATTAAAAIDTNIKVYGDCKTPTFEPKGIILACADVGSVVEIQSWTSWTATSATGNGTWSYKDCIPDCASGKVRSLSTHITLTTPVRDPNGQLVWSQLQATQKPPGYDAGPQSLPTQPD